MSINTIWLAKCPSILLVAIPIDDLEHLGSRITLKSTKVLVHVLSVRKSTLKGELNRLYGYEARSSVDNDDVEIRVVSTVYPGGATTNGPDATTPPAICQNSGGGGSWGGGGGPAGGRGGGIPAGGRGGGLGLGLG